MSVATSAARQTTLSCIFKKNWKEKLEHDVEVKKKKRLDKIFLERHSINNNNREHAATSSVSFI